MPATELQDGLLDRPINEWRGAMGEIVASMKLENGEDQGIVRGC